MSGSELCKRVTEILQLHIDTYPDAIWQLITPRTEDVVSDFGNLHVKLDFTIEGFCEKPQAVPKDKSKSTEDDDPAIKTLSELLEKVDPDVFSGLLEVFYAFSLTTGGQKLQNSEYAINCFRLLVALGEIATSVKNADSIVDIQKHLAGAMLRALGKE